MAKDSVIARFIVDVVDAGADKPWDVSLTSERDQGRWAQQKFSGAFTLDKVIDPNGGIFPASPYPLHPPSQHAVSLKGPAATIDFIRSAYASIVDRKDPQIEVYGHYLFDALLGGDDPEVGNRWLAMLEHAEYVGANVVELALAFHDVPDQPQPANERSHPVSGLSRLHWEMLHSNDHFLAAGTPPKLRVAITRLVGTGATREHPQLSAPPKVLFVVGTSLTDREVRPGAELIGLLRRLDNQRAIDRRLLERAAPTSIRETVGSFDPDIVHLICHGNEEQGEPYLLLTVKDDTGIEVVKRQYAPQLGTLLQAPGGKHPKIAVLSACHSGGSSGSERYALADTHANVPLAEALVKGGIPIVVGMGGQVTDLTCRLFTRQFAEAVIDGEQLVVAIAEARTAVFLESPDLRAKPDWALPALFLDRTLRSDFRPVQASTEDPKWAQIDEWIYSVGLLEEPVFCGRAELFPKFQALFERGAGKSKARVLALLARDEGMGRRRLLMELAIRALLDGNMPVLVTRENNEAVDVLGLAQLIDDAIGRSRFWTLGGGTSQLRLLAQRKDDRLDADIRERLEDSEVPTPLVLRMAIQRDVDAFREQAQARYAFLKDGLVVVLIDKAETFGEAGVRALFLDEGKGAGRALGPLGFGAADTPIPVVVSFLLGGGTNELLKDASESKDKWMVSEELQAFTDEQTALAYRWVLLNLFRDFKDRSLLTEIAGKGWMLDDDHPDYADWDKDLRDSIQNRPGRLNHETFFTTAVWAKRRNVLIPADDAAALAKVRGTA